MRNITRRSAAMAIAFLLALSSMALAAPKSEQHPCRFGAAQRNGTVGEIDDISPFDDFVQRRCIANPLPQPLDARQPPAIKASDIGIGIGGWR